MVGGESDRQLRDSLLNYLGNRAEFYDTLLPRIPLLRWRDALREAVGGIEPEPETETAARSLTTETLPNGDFAQALALRDLLKKPGSGRALARTVISIEEALERSEMVEETGMLLFDHLAAGQQESGATFDAEAERRRAALSAVLRLSDDLRYRRREPS